MRNSFHNIFCKAFSIMLLGCGLLAPHAGAQTADLPIRKVVLYKHGVGFFERAADVAAGESIRLQFKANEMDDVLKSLTIDSQRGAVASVRYDSSDPLSKKLENFPFRLGGGDPLSRILDQFKGARVRLRLAKDAIEGTIISSRTLAATERQAETHRLLLLTDDGEMQTVDPAAALGLRFVDTRLQEQFREYLMLIAGARNREKRNVVIETVGDSGGSISARYGDAISLSFIQMQYDLFNGQRDASSAPLTMADDGIASLSNDVAVPADALGASGRLLFQNRGQRKGFTFSGNCAESLKHVILALG